MKLRTFKNMPYLVLENHGLKIALTTGPAKKICRKSAIEKFLTSNVNQLVIIVEGPAYPWRNTENRLTHGHVIITITEDTTTVIKIG